MRPVLSDRAKMNYELLALISRHLVDDVGAEAVVAIGLAGQRQEQFFDVLLAGWELI